MPAARMQAAATVLAATRIGFVSAMAWRVDATWDMTDQVKPDCYLVTPTAGAIRFGWNRRMELLRPGEIALAPTGAPLRGRLARGHRHADLLVVHAQLETDWGPSLPALATRRRARLPLAEAQAERLRDLISFCGHQPAAGLRHGEAVIGALLGDLLLKGSLQVDPPSDAFDPRIATALRQLRADPSSDMRVEDLAARCGLRPVRFRQLFKEALGVGPTRYHLQLRLDHAARRLRSGNEAIGVIAADLGFANQPYFQQRFKARFGCTPGAFRDQAGGM